MAELKTKLIVNPKSAGGETEKNWASLEAKLRGPLGNFDYDFTTVANGATELTRDALAKGYEKIVAIGGDGTLSETVNGFFNFETDKPINSQAIFSFVMCGRGNDFRKTFNISDNLESAINRAANGTIRDADVGKVSFEKNSGGQTHRYFLNIASFGMSGDVDQKVNEGTASFLGGTGAFLLASLQTLITYENKFIELTVDDQKRQGKMRLVAIANGQYAGGGMHFAPGAQVDDGLFDVIIMGDIDKLDSALNTGKLYQGEILNHPKVERIQGRKVTASSDKEVLIDVDGEQPGRLPAIFEIMPATIRLQC